MTNNYKNATTAMRSRIPALEREPDLSYRIGDVPIERWTLVHTASYVRQVLGVDARVIGRNVYAAEPVQVDQSAVAAWVNARAIGEEL